MQSSLKIVNAEEPPRRTPEREELAAAIEKHTELTAQLAACKTAQATTQQQRRAAQEVVNQSPKLIEEAKAAAAKFLTEQAMGSIGAPPPSIKEARANAQEAQDELDAAISASDALAKQRKEAEDSLALAKLSLDSAVWKVIATDPATLALVAAFKKKLRDLTDMRRALEFLEGRLPPDMRSWRSAEEWPELPGAAPWHEALECLKQDADAPLLVS